VSWTDYFAYSWAWVLLILLPVLWWLGRSRSRRARQLARQAAGLLGWQQVVGWSAWRRQMGLLLAGLFLVIAATGPQWGHDPKQRVAFGRDVVIVLDISRSMLARDRSDAQSTQLLSRLERAKSYLADWLDVLERRGGYRLGVVWFAGQARLVCPLTDDYQHVRAVIELAHPDFWGPAGRLAMSERGAIGTSLRQALEVAVEAHDPAARDFQDILLISDGDDQDISPADLADQARQRSIRIHALGVGRSEPAAYIPGPNPQEFLQWDGQIVQTRRRDDLLTTLARVSGGEYIPEETASQPLVHWWVHTLSREPKRAWSPFGPPRPKQQSEPFFAAALLLFLVALA